jgi:hypothetical protein
MGRSTAISRLFSHLRAGSAVAAGLATILSCTDGSTAPSALSRRNPALDGVKIVAFHVPDSLKHVGPQAAAARMLGGLGISRDVTADPDTTPSIYTVSTVAFAPEPSPANTVLPDPSEPNPDCGDCVAYHVPIGFNFTFYGNSFSQLAISSNGLIKLGSDESLFDGCCWGGQIPDNDLYNNIIAVAWTDLDPSTPGDIAFETQGTAPRRKFVVQWNNVPELRGPFGQVQGHVTAQLVLSEGSNDITIYTTSMDFTGDTHFVTQGIENADGSEAAYGILADGTPRVQARFSLTNDGIRFRIRPIGKPITIVAPPNLNLGTNARACFATVVLGQPTVAGGLGALAVIGHRNDGLPLDATYPVGVTTITWSATDTIGTTELASQTVTVTDREAPQIFLPSNAVVRNDPGLATAVVNVGVGRVEDNCPNYTLSDPPNGVYPVGTTQAVWTARDEAGNVSTATQLVTVKDVEAPTLVLPQSITVNATSPSGAPVPFGGYGQDNVGVTSFSCTPMSGTKFRIGRTFVACSALDAAGNKSAPVPLVVNVLGAQEQIANLIASIRAVLPVGEKYDEHRDHDGHHYGRRGNQPLSVLSSALSSAQLNSRYPRGACPALDLIAAIVRANTPDVFPAANSAQILADIARIESVLGCRRESEHH